MSSAPPARPPRRVVHLVFAVVLWAGWLLYVGHGLVTHSRLEGTTVGVGLVLAAAWTWIWWNGGVPGRRR